MEQKYKLQYRSRFNNCWKDSAFIKCDTFEICKQYADIHPEMGYRIVEFERSQEPVTVPKFFEKLDDEKQMNINFAEDSKCR